MFLFLSLRLVDLLIRLNYLLSINILCIYIDIQIAKTYLECFKYLRAKKSGTNTFLIN